MLYLLLIDVNKRTRNTYGLIKKAVRTGFHLADETTWLKKKKIKISNSKGRTWGVMAYFIILPVLLCRETVSVDVKKNIRCRANNWKGVM